MAITFSPLESKSGFSSPNFTVDNLGNLTAAVINSNLINAETIFLNGSPIIGSGSSPVLFELTGDFRVTEGSTPYISIVNGQVQITNRSDSVGTLDNIDIGTITPATAEFTDLTVTGDVNISPISGKIFTLDPVDIGTIDNVNIGVTTEGTGRFSSLEITNEATLDTEVPTKGYVDNQINLFSTAFSIAFGA